MITIRQNYRGQQDLFFVAFWQDSAADDTTTESDPGIAAFHHRKRRYIA
jgi:hypothetical protein